MKFSDLQSGTTIKLRTGYAGREDVDWHAWKNAEIYIERNPAGEIFLITLADGTWAEYGRYDWSPHYNVFECEGYYMEIDGLTGDLE